MAGPRATGSEEARAGPAAKKGEPTTTEAREPGSAEAREPTTTEAREPSAAEARAVIDEVMRQDRGRVLAALVAGLRDFDLAEEALADATESAVIHWARTGPPACPRAWLLRVARRKAIDRIRRKARFADRVKDIEMLAAADEDAATAEAPDIPDERLALIFTCCHPALDPKSRVALTLRSLGGLTTAEVARAFLDSEPTMGQRLSRAKAKIARAGIGFAVPGRELWPERLESVLTVVYLIYNQCYSTGGGPLPGREEDLCDEALYLARMVRCMLPAEREVEGLLGLLLLTQGRRAARQDGTGQSVPLPHQDAARWDAAMLAEGLALVDAAGPDASAGPFVLQARIAAEHMRNGPGRTDWARVLRLYDRLLERLGTAVVALNRAVAVAEVHGVRRGLTELDALAEELDGYQPYHAARADFLARDGQWAAARDAYGIAIAAAPGPADARLLAACRDALPV